MDAPVPRRVHLLPWREMAHSGRCYLEVYTYRGLPLYMESVRLALPNLDLLQCTYRLFWEQASLDHSAEPLMSISAASPSGGQVTLRRSLCAAYPSPTRPSRVAGCGQDCMIPSVCYTLYPGAATRDVTSSASFFAPAKWFAYPHKGSRSVIEMTAIQLHAFETISFLESDKSHLLPWEHGILLRRSDSASRGSPREAGATELHNTNSSLTPAKDP
jgi:hypothetical protein